MHCHKNILVDKLVSHTVVSGEGYNSGVPHKGLRRQKPQITNLWLLSPLTHSLSLLMALTQKNQDTALYLQLFTVAAQSAMSKVFEVLVDKSLNSREPPTPPPPPPPPTHTHTSPQAG